MQISGGTVTISGGTVRFESPTPTAGYVSGDPALALGVIDTWTSNTYMHTGLGISTVQGNDYQNDTNNMVWYVFYAHQQIRLPAAPYRIGTMVRQSGANSWQYSLAVSSSNNTKSNFNSNVDVKITALGGVGTGTGGYVGNILSEANVTTQVIIPANRYFIIGQTGGPYYKNYRKSANNYTIVNNGNAIVTVLNEIYHAGWPTGPTAGVPTLLGGNVSGYTKFTGNLQVGSYKFQLG